MGPSFDKNPRNGGSQSQRFHEIENLPVNRYIKMINIRKKILKMNQRHFP